MMMRELLEVKKDKPRMFQVLLLNNNSSQGVEVQEAEQVDFRKIQEHLSQGGSVFITSKRSQKLPILSKTKGKKLENNNCTREITAFYFDHI